MLPPPMPPPGGGDPLAQLLGGGMDPMAADSTQGGLAGAGMGVCPMCGAPLANGTGAMPGPLPGMPPGMPMQEESPLAGLLMGGGAGGPPPPMGY